VRLWANEKTPALCRRSGDRVPSDLPALRSRIAPCGSTRAAKLALQKEWAVRAISYGTCSMPWHSRCSQFPPSKARQGPRRAVACKAAKVKRRVDNCYLACRQALVCISVQQCARHRRTNKLVLRIVYLVLYYTYKVLYLYFLVNYYILYTALNLEL